VWTIFSQDGKDEVKHNNGKTDFHGAAVEHIMVLSKEIIRTC
jgi:hypothetical protein